jgi:hypothetical protein
MTKRTIAILGAVATIIVPGVANAQEWLKDRAYQEGAGIRTGDLELHPGIAGEIGYDSNYLLRSSSNAPGLVNGNPVGAGVIRITPSLSLSTLGPQRREGDAKAEAPSIRFRANLSGTYREFIGNSLIEQQRNFSAGADARLEILPEHEWGGAVFANYTRTIQPNVVGDPDLAFNRDDVGVGAEIIANPNRGTLDWHFGYQFHDTLFEQTEGKPFDNTTQEAFTRGRWKFRPQTALIYDATFRFINYTDPVTGAGALPNSTPVRARIGLNGLITSRFAFLGLIGYGASFYDTSLNAATPQYDSVIGQAELKWFLSANPNESPTNEASLVLSSIAVGYTRDFQNSYLGAYYGSDRGYAKISYFFAGRALISLEGGVGAIEYPTIFYAQPLAVEHAPFTDVRADATLYGEYRFSNSFAINVTGRYTQNFSNVVLQETPGATNTAYDLSWQRLEAYAGVRWFM